MTYFYSNSLAYSDKDFLLSIADKKGKEYTYKLLNCKLIISRLKLIDFSEEEILNCDLLSFLLKNDVVYKKQLYNFLDCIKNNEASEFINIFMSNMDEASKQAFVKKFNNHWDGACSWITKDIWDGDFDEELAREYIQKTIMYSSDEDIKRNNQEFLSDEKDQRPVYVIKKFIDEDWQFLDDKLSNTERIIDVFYKLKIKIKDTNFGVFNKKLFMKIYQNNFYEINKDMIPLILKEIYKIPESIDYKEKNYSLIMSQKDQPLNKYVNENINEYLEFVFKQNPSKITDELPYALMILNNYEITDELKNKYIDLLVTKIDYIKEVKDEELWSILLDKDLVADNDENLLDYYFKKDNKLDESLINYINKSINKFNTTYDFINKQYGDGSSSKFYKSIVSCNEINNNKYKQILKKLNRTYEEFSIIDIESDKINILIELAIIQMNKKTLEFIRKNYKENIINYITTNIDKYINETLSKENFIYEEMLNILKEDIEEDKKLKLAALTDKSISIKEKNYSTQLKEYILENNFNKDDIEYIINEYINEDNKIKGLIKLILKENIDKVKEEEYALDYELLMDIFEDDKICKEDKLILIANSIKHLENIKIYKCFNKLNMNEFMDLFNRRKSKFYVDEINERVLEALKDKGIINKYELIDDNDGIQWYTAHGKKIIDKNNNSLLMVN